MLKQADLDRIFDFVFGKNELELCTAFSHCLLSREWQRHVCTSTDKYQKRTKKITKKITKKYIPAILRNERVSSSESKTETDSSVLMQNKLSLFKHLRRHSSIASTTT